MLRTDRSRAPVLAWRGGRADAEVVHWGLLFTAMGAFAGWLGSHVLRRARRPASVPAGWCAAGTAVLWSVVAWRWGAGGFPAWWLPLPLAVTALAVPLVLADAGHRRLPDALTLPAYPVVGVALGAAAFGGGGGDLVLRATLAGAGFLAAHAAVHGMAPQALGAGDVKLSGSVGAVLGAAGWAALVLAAVAAALASLALAAAAALLRVRRWSSGVPHGPGLLAATCLIVTFPGTGSEVGMGS
jgi:leader peptidase (prepilin peptidase)/N-methyltransferase